MAEQPTLSTSRLVLRPFTVADAPGVQRLAGVAEVAATTLNIPHPYLDGMAEAWIATHAPAWDARAAVTFAIVSTGHELRGAITLLLAATHQRGELGYWVGRPYWGQGLATEAATAVLGFAFRELALHRVQALCFTRNPASGRVLQKLGMTLEGVHRAYFIKNGRLEDVAQHAILHTDWLKRGAA